MKPEILAAKDVKAESRTSPAKRLIDAAKEQGDYTTTEEVAERYGVHIETIRRLCRSGKVNAPTAATRTGKLVIYLFTPADLEELDRYFSNKDQISIENPVHKQIKQ